MQFSSVNKRHDLSNSEKWAVFRYEVSKICGCNMQEPIVATGKSKNENSGNDEDDESVNDNEEKTVIDVMNPPRKPGQKVTFDNDE